MRVLGWLSLAWWGIAGSAIAQDQHFQSPSGNILCEVGEDGAFVRCDLGVDRQSYRDAPASCTGDWGRSFGVAASGAGFLICATSDIDAPDDPVVLPYGVALVLEAITCLSEPTGMTCTNGDGGGFMVRRAEQRIF